MKIVRDNSWEDGSLSVTAGAPESHYCIQAKARQMNAGQWSCTAGEFDWTYGGDEIVSILEGGAYLTYAGKTQLVFAGDTVHFKRGTTVHWRIEKHIRKFWVIGAPTLLERVVHFFRKTK